MSLELLSNRLEFLREAERLKDVLRSAHTSSGRRKAPPNIAGGFA